MATPLGVADVAAARGSGKRRRGLPRGARAPGARSRREPAAAERAGAAARAGGGALGALLVAAPRERPLPDRLHRVRTRWLSSGAGRARFFTDFRYHRARTRRSASCWSSTSWTRTLVATTGRPPGRPRPRAPSGSGSSRHVLSPPSWRWPAAPARPSWCRRRWLVEGLRAVKDAGELDAILRRARPPRRRATRSSRGGLRRPHRARGRPGASRSCSPRAGRRAVLPADRGLRRERRDAARRAARRGDRGRHARRRRPGRRDRRLLLRLHAHLRDRRVGRGLRAMYESCRARSWRRSRRRPGAVHRGATRTRAPHHRQAGYGDSSATAPGTASGSRSTRRRASRRDRRRSSSPATSSPSSPASTCPGAAACASRTSSS